MGLLLSLLGLGSCRREEPRGPPPPEIADAVEAARRAWTDPDPFVAWLRVSCEMAKIRQSVQDTPRADELVRMVARYAPPPSPEAERRVDRAMGAA